MSAVLIVVFFAFPTFAQSADIFNVAAIAKGIEDASRTVEQVNGDAVLVGSELSEKDTLFVIATMYADDLIRFDVDATMLLKNDNFK